MAKAKKLPSGNWRVRASTTINGEKIMRSFTDKTSNGAENQAREWQEHCKMIGSDFTKMRVKEAIKFYVQINHNNILLLSLDLPYNKHQI